MDRSFERPTFKESNMTEESSGSAPAESGGSQPQASESPGTTQEPTVSKTEVDEETGIELPGVVSRNAGNKHIPDIPTRGPDGKFRSRQQREQDLEKEMAEEKKAFEPPEPEVKPEPKPEDKNVPEPPPGSEKKDSQAPEKFVFAGEEYESQEKAEQSIRSLKGMFKPLTEERDAERTRADQAVDSAIQWRDYAQKLEAEKKAGQPDSPAPHGTQPPAEGQQAFDYAKILQSIDGQAFEKIAQDPDKGLPIAGRFLAAQIMDAVTNELLPQYRQQILDEVNKGIDPIREQQEFNQAAESVKDMFVNASQLRDAEGNQAFPELNDPEIAYKIGELWRQSDLPADIAMTPKGLIQAIAQFRLYHGAPQRQAPEPEAKPDPEPTPTAPPPAAAASESGDSGIARPGSPAGNADNAFARALDETQLVDPVLGFARRRR
jgi:hypothetical protein